MAEYLRVRDKATGHEYTVRAEHFNREAHQRLDKDPLGTDGLPREPKYRVELGERPAPSASSARAPRRTRKAAQPVPTTNPVTPDPTAEDGAPETDDGQPAESEQENH